jgi:hypothetical protein
MRGVIIKEGEYGHRRKTACCSRQTRAGDSVVIIDNRDHGALKGTIILHKRCIEELCEALPPDARDSRAHFKKLREEILASGNPFPEINTSQGRRGVRAVLVADLEE